MNEPAADDVELLHRYVAEASETAFAALVRGRVDLVYSAALRRVGGDVHLAEDVTQQVFVALAQQARALAGRASFVGWLYTTTRFAAAQAVRVERRRRAREEEAEIMNRQTTEETAAATDWERLRPVLDAALDELKEAERDAVLLRFFAGRNYAEIGVKLSLGENTARMRVERALDKLQGLLAKRGVTSTAGALAMALGSQAVTAAPVGLAAAVTGVALAAGAGGGGAVAVAGFMGMTKLQVALSGVLLVGGVGGLTWQHRANARLATELETLRQTSAANVAQSNERRPQADARAGEAQARREQGDAELARLGEEAAALKQRLAAEARAAATARGGEGGARFSGPIFNLSQVDQKPTPKFRQPPDYPERERKAEREGEVLVEFVVDPVGKVQDVRALKATSEDFAAAAVAALKKWRFQPGQKEGVPVGVRMQQRITFSLSKEKRPPAPTWF